MVTAINLYGAVFFQNRRRRSSEDDRRYWRYFRFPGLSDEDAPKWKSAQVDQRGDGNSEAR